MNSLRIVLTITHEGVCSLHFMLMGESVSVLCETLSECVYVCVCVRVRACMCVRVHAPLG